MPDFVLVTGGAGYIGAHMVKLLRRSARRVVVFDNLSTGHSDAVGDTELVVGDLRDAPAIASLLAGRKFDAVLHFAAKCYVGESVLKPAEYYDNNVIGTLNLLSAMRDAGVRKLVFSSSCSTYGNPLSASISEDHPQQPINPYGFSKLVGEQAMNDYGRAYGLRTVALRYFNAAGLDPDGDLGERHEPETHLIPLVLRQALRERAGAPAHATQLKVFGNDFDTPDGTCIRDYVHVSDLCDAHLHALDRLSDGGPAFEAFNLGSEKGSSVLEVINECRRITGGPIAYEFAPRRAGDPSRLVAASGRARDVLRWKPRYTELSEVVSTAWHWFSKTC